MPSLHKMAMMTSLLRREVPKELAALAADAVHPFVELGNWPPNRRAEKEAKAVAGRVARAIGRYRDAVPVEALKGWTRWAFSEYARIAGEGSRAGRVFADAANHPQLREGGAPIASSQAAQQQDEELDRMEDELDHVWAELVALGMRNPDSDGYDCPFCDERVSWQSLGLEADSSSRDQLAVFKHGYRCELNEGGKGGRRWKELKARQLTLTLEID